MITFALIPFLLFLIVPAVFWFYDRGGLDNAPKNVAARLERIRNASWWMQALTGFSLLLGIYWTVAFLFRWPFFGQNPPRIAISHDQIYTALAQMPTDVKIWWLVQTCWGLVLYGILFSLFRLYEKGILFSPKNVRHIRALAYWLIVNWAIDYFLQPAGSVKEVSLTPLLVAPLIIFVSWIMDEGRKMQEEQELTV
jgi:hypothetical protein